MEDGLPIEDRIAYWEKFEKFVMDIINEKYETSYAKNIDKFWVDLTLGWKHWIEVKQDDKVDSTWNYFIEVEQYWKKSWILKKENMDFYCIGNYDEFYGIKREKLIEIILRQWTRITGWNIDTVWYLISKELLKEHCNFSY